MISKLEFPDGINLPKDPTTMQAEIVGLMLRSFADLEMLPSGVYNVTPRIWTKHTHNHELTVLDNGQGLYRIYPRDPGVGFVESATEGGITAFRQGGRMNPINTESPLAIVAGGHPSKQELQIFSVIAHLLR